MTRHPCTCGYQADDPDDLAIHLGEMFIPADDTAPDGQVHCETAPGTPGTLTCRCGHTGTTSDFDRHLLTVFTPASRTGHDGRHHSPCE